jgi:hypothetical protein
VSAQGSATTATGAATTATAAVAAAVEASGALSYVFSTQTADADPGNGALRLNNAAMQSATQVYVDLSDRMGNVVTSILDAMDDSTNPSAKAIIRLFQPSSGLMATYRLTATVSPAGYRKLTVQYVGGSGGTFANNETVGLTWSQVGDQQGASGLNTQVQFNDATQFAGDPNFTFNKLTGVLSVSGLTLANGLTVNGSSSTGNISPNAQNTYALGSAALQWNALFASISYHYNSYIDASNYERLAIYAASGSYYVQSQHAGSGLYRDLYLSGQNVGIMTNEVLRWTFDYQGHLLPASALTSNVGSPASRVGSFYGANIDLSGTVTAQGTGTYSGDVSARLFQATGFLNVAAGVASSGISLWGSGVAHANIAWMPNERTFRFVTGNNATDVANSYGVTAIEAGWFISTNSEASVRLKSSGGKTWDVVSGANGNVSPNYFGLRNVTDNVTALTLSPTGDLALSGNFQANGVGSNYLTGGPTYFNTIYPNTQNTYAIGAPNAQWSTLTVASMFSYNSYTDPSNYERFAGFWSSNQWVMSTQNLGTGVFRAMTFSASAFNFLTSGVTRAIIDGSGNLGLGTSPYSWQNTYKGLDLQSYLSVYSTTSGGTAGIASNAYVNSGSANWQRKFGGFATLYQQSVNDGGHRWFSASNGIADSVASWSQTMMLDTVGSLSVFGGSQPQMRIVASATQSNLRFDSSYTAGSGGQNKNWAIVHSHTAYGDLVFRIGNAEGSDPVNTGTTVVSLTSAGLKVLGQLAVSNPAASAWGTFATGSAAGSYFAFARGGSAAALGYIGSDGGGILAGGTGAKFGIRSEDELLLMAHAGVEVVTLGTGGLSLPNTMALRSTSYDMVRTNGDGSVDHLGYAGYRGLLGVNGATYVYAGDAAGTIMLSVSTGGMAIAGSINPQSRNTYTLGDASGNYWNAAYFGPNGFAAYNTFTDASNYERLSSFWAGNIACFGTQALGTGVARRVRILAGDGVLELTNSATTDFNLLRFGLGTSSFPALRRTGAGLDVVTADNTAWAKLSAGVVESMSYIKTATYTVGTLPSAATAGIGARAFVTDSSLVYSGTNLGSNVTAGGAWYCPVYSDGITWRIG